MKLQIETIAPAATAAKSSGRFALSSARVVPNCDGAWIVATDSQCLSVAHCGTEGELPEKGMQFPGKAFPAKKTNGPLEMVAPSEELYGLFPRCSSVFDELPPETIHVCLDAELLLKVAKALTQRGQRQLGLQLSIDPTGNVKPVVLTPVSNEQEHPGIGLLMPMVGEMELSTADVNARISAITADLRKAE